MHIRTPHLLRTVVITLVIVVGLSNCNLPATPPTPIPTTVSVNTPTEAVTNTPENKPTATVTSTPESTPTTTTPTATATATPDAPTSDGETHALLFRIPRGAEGISYQGENMPEMQISGPSAFTVGPDGSFWVIDNPEQRLLHYSSSGERINIITLQDRPRVLIDMVVGDNDIYLFDAFPTPPEILRMDRDGTLRQTYQLPDNLFRDSMPYGLALDDDGADGSLLLLWLNRPPVRLLDAAGTLNPTELPGMIHQGRTYTTRVPDLNQPEVDLSRGAISAGDQEIPVVVDHHLGGLRVLGFAPDSSFFVKMEEIIGDVPFIVDQTVRHYAADGSLLGMARYPLAEQYSYVQHNLEIGPDGAAYALLTRPDGAEVLRLRFAPALQPLPPPAPEPATTEFSDTDGRWRIRYPADQLSQEIFDNDISIFISADRTTFAAVDSFVAAGDAYGNTGEELRNRARTTLERIYGQPVIEEEIIAAPPEPWATGIRFTTAQGSKGVALYRQPGRSQGDYQVYGFLYGYKAANEAEALPLVQAMQVSLQMEGDR